VDVEVLQLFIVVLCPRPKFHSGVSTVEFVGIARFAAPYLSGGANRTVDLKLHQSQLAGRLFLELVYCHYTSPLLPQWRVLSFLGDDRLASLFFIVGYTPRREMFHCAGYYCFGVLSPLTIASPNYQLSSLTTLLGNGSIGQR
jgi:hypothetical protein